ncbi:MAG: DedA family protein [Deltaproteobacteria bacterium]|nr:DedA family protein [Deltaproteobacteria bacterium]
MDLDGAIRFFIEQNQIVALCVLAVVSALEYVVPPVPGDVSTFAAAFLVSIYGWPLLPVFLAIITGGLAGASVNYWIGALINRNRGEWMLRFHKGEGVRRRIEAILDKFNRYGAVLIAVNRFIPGIRALFFVAAGMAGIPLPKVLFYSLVSAVVWNSLIFALGYYVGTNIELFKSIVSDYFTAIWIVIAAAAALLFIRYLARRRAAR